MSKNGPILVVEDNPPDRQTLREALTISQTGNELIFLSSAAETLEFLRNQKKIPFLILCDVNLPKMDGIELKKKIDKTLSLQVRNIPFIFYSSFDSNYAVMEAYNSLTVQGFFQKDNACRELKEVIKAITEYWRLCRLPSYPISTKMIIKSHKN